MQAVKKIINFSAGPAKVPQEVLKLAQEELLNYNGSGISVMEMSHRSPAFEKIIKTTEQDLRDILTIPDNYKVLFLQGGATGQFASVPLNLSSGSDAAVDYVVTGNWSSKAGKEAQKYCKVNLVLPKASKYTEIPDHREWNTSNNADYLYYCDNETVHGIEFTEIPETTAPLVCDMTSNFLTRPVDVSKFGCIIAGAQKNFGIAGLSVVIVREDLIGKAMTVCPSVLDYKVMADNNSLYNTPPCYAIYISGLWLKYLKKLGGLDKVADLSAKKSELIYDIIDNSNGFYFNGINKKDRSRITVVFRVGGSSGNEALEKKFIAEAEKKGLIQLKGHRSVGGMRASLFNAMPFEEVQILAQFMKDFQQENGSAQNGL